MKRLLTLQKYRTLFAVSGLVVREFKKLYAPKEEKSKCSVKGRR